MGLFKIGQVIIAGGAFRWADMRKAGETVVYVQVGDYCDMIQLQGEEDRAWREMFLEGKDPLMAMGSGMAN